MRTSQSIYQAVILKHHRNPRNEGVMEDPSCTGNAINSMCGDSVSLSLQLDLNGLVSGIRFSCEGCAVTKASASIMTELVVNISFKQALERKEGFERLLAGDSSFFQDSGSDILAFSNLNQFPSRAKCAFLAWEALGDAFSKTK